MPEASFLYYLRSCSWALGILSKTVTEKALLELQTKRKGCSTWNTHIKIWRPSSEQKAFQVTPLLETKTWYYCHLMTYCSIRIALKYIKTRRGCRAKKKKKNSTGTLFFFSLQWCFSWSFPFICRCSGQKSTLFSLSKQSICPETDQNREGSIQVLTKPNSIRHFLWTSIQKHHSPLDKSQTVSSVLDYFRWLECRVLDSRNSHRATVAGKH